MPLALAVAQALSAVWPSSARPNRAYTVKEVAAMETLQDEAVKQVKQIATNFFHLLQNHKGTNKDQTIKTSAKSYYEQSNKRLPLLFGKRWEQSSLIPRWNRFQTAWNNGDCSWTEVFKVYKLFYEGLQQSD